MAFYEVSYSDDAVTFVNTKTNKAEKLELFDAMDDLDAIRIVNGEIKARDNVSKASVSLLSHLLNNPRLGAYKGTTPLDESVPNELKSAIREIETEYLKPIFSAPLTSKGQSPATVEKQWQLFAAGLREGGGYANAKSRVIKYFAHVGQLPIASNGKCLTVAAIDKILVNEMQKIAPETKEGIAGKLVKLSSDINNRKETTDLGDYATAIAALKAMLSTYEGLYRESLETMTALKGNPENNVQSKATDAMAKIMEKPSVESLDAMRENGQMDDVTYQIAMLEHHGIEVLFEEEAPL
ncbi:hypothetical protein UFOVP249_21 [uncultured Caudovirales phage]|uniref:Uncharacterized protein n=1 Tax=uncultured Caudovirales phage TaxID=2100421 RepID=A0A6J5LIF4_9CAUD|nr:hypothetical protein UFOVP249_21 [uncultured Caudovirales phage]